MIFENPQCSKSLYYLPMWLSKDLTAEIPCYLKTKSQNCNMIFKKYNKRSTHKLCKTVTTVNIQYIGNTYYYISENLKAEYILYKT